MRGNKEKTYYFNGHNLTLQQWSEKVGIPKSTLQCRLTQRGWSIERTLTEAKHPPKVTAERTRSRFLKISNV